MISDLHNLIEKECPIYGISIGRKNDKSTWLPQFKETATSEQISAAQLIIKNVELSILDDGIYISKLTIMNRLNAVGMLIQAISILNSDPVKSAKWNAATEIAINDPDVILVLTAIGIDPSAVLY